MNEIKAVFQKKKTLWIPLLFFFMQLVSMISLEWLIIETPSQFSHLTYLEFLWQGVFVKPIEEELFFRILLVALMFFVTYGYIYGGEGISNRLKAVMRDTLNLTKQGSRFPFKFQWRYSRDQNLAIFLIVSSFFFGLYHIGGYGIYKIVPTFLMGLLLGWLYLRYGGLACIAYHSIHNFILITAGFYFSEYACLVE